MLWQYKGYDIISRQHYYMWIFPPFDDIFPWQIETDKQNITFFQLNKQISMCFYMTAGRLNHRANSINYVFGPSKNTVTEERLWNFYGLFSL